MKIPDGMTEADVLESIDRVANRLAAKFKFGYHDIEDMKQTARIYALQAIDNYDPTKGASLDSFLWLHVRNRLYNFKRDNYERPKPCLNCPLKAYNPNLPSECEKYTDKMECDLYESWFSRNSSKKNLMAPIEITCVRDEQENSMKDNTEVGDIIDRKHIIDTIDSNMPVNMRSDWVKLKNDIKIPKAKRQKLLDEIERILTEANINVKEAW